MAESIVAGTLWDDQSIGHKRCTKCGTSKPLKDFAWNKPQHRLQSECRKCQGERARQWQQSHPVKMRESRQRSERKCGHQRKRKYGVTPEEFDRMLEIQNGRCAICNEHETQRQEGKLKGLCIDHDHKTGEIRRLLCHRCNLVIGRVHEDSALLRAAAEYLDGFKEKRHAVCARMGHGSRCPAGR